MVTDETIYTRGTRISDDRREVAGTTLEEAVQRAALEKAMIALDEQIRGMRLEFDIERGDDKWDVSVGWEPTEGLVIITKKHERMEL